MNETESKDFIAGVKRRRFRARPLEYSREGPETYPSVMQLDLVLPSRPVKNDSVWHNIHRKFCDDWFYLPLTVAPEGLNLG